MRSTDRALLVHRCCVADELFRLHVLLWHLLLWLCLLWLYLLGADELFRLHALLPGLLAKGGVCSHFMFN